MLGEPTMADDWEDFLVQLRLDIKSRVKDQLERHQRVSPNIDPRQVIDIQISQEKERLERIADKLDEDGEDRGAAVTRALIEEWLPWLALSIKRP